MAISTPTASSSMADGTSTGVLLEPTTQSFIDALSAAGGPPLYTLSPAEARGILAGAQTQRPIQRRERLSSGLASTSGNCRLSCARTDSSCAIRLRPTLPAVLAWSVRLIGIGSMSWLW